MFAHQEKSYGNNKKQFKENPKQWEIDKRKELETEIPDGTYKIGIESNPIFTGKGGRIDWEISLLKEGLKDN